MSEEDHSYSAEYNGPTTTSSSVAKRRTTKAKAGKANNRKDRLNRAKQGVLGYGGGGVSTQHEQEFEDYDDDENEEQQQLKPQQQQSQPQHNIGSTRRKQDGSSKSRSCSVKDFCTFLVACLFFVLLEVGNFSNNVKGSWGSFLLDATSIANQRPDKYNNETSTLISGEGNAEQQQQQSTTAAAPDAAALEQEKQIEEPPPSPPPPPLPPMDPNHENFNKIAWVVPLFKGCNPETNPNLIEAAIVLRHSIHTYASKWGATNSRYDYQMYALVLNGKGCPTDELSELGYIVHKVDVPLDVNQIQNPYLQIHIQKPSGFGRDDKGVDQFIQLMAHTLVKEPIFVMLYLNSVITQKFDPLFQAMQYHNPNQHHHHNDSSTVAVKVATDLDTARNTIQTMLLERTTDILPIPADTTPGIEHYFVRDYPNTGFGRKPVIHRGGFWISRTNPALQQHAIQLIVNQKENYLEGNELGWGGKGYSKYYLEGMTIPGFMAYLLDEFYSERSIELSGCLFGHNGMDNRFRGPPRYHPSFIAQHQGKCRSNTEGCGDCTTTSANKIFHILYDRQTCEKPWACMGEGEKGDETDQNINTQCTTVEHCLELQGEWHRIRNDIETKLILVEPDVQFAQSGPYKRESFYGHCYAHKSYVSFIKSLSEDTRKRIPELLWGNRDKQAR